MEESAGLGTSTAVMAWNGCGNKKSVTQIPLSESLSLLISYQVTKTLWREEAQGERKRALTPAGARGGWLKSEGNSGCLNTVPLASVPSSCCQTRHCFPPRVHKGLSDSSCWSAVPGRESSALGWGPSCHLSKEGGFGDLLHSHLPPTPTIPTSSSCPPTPWDSLCGRG